LTSSKITIAIFRFTTDQRLPAGSREAPQLLLPHIVTFVVVASALSVAPCINPASLDRPSKQ
jgi:hypothetical protein